mmetsp:Transcript_34814/g.33127  ORF Transcript_34814/g.33127 Transcript_34814/m.33127 type:complete len:124 (-) Transcript_34814:1046-1417(-)
MASRDIVENEKYPIAPARPLVNEIDAKAAVIALGVSTYKSAITALFVDSQVPLPTPYITRYGSMNPQVPNVSLENKKRANPAKARHIPPTVITMDFPNLLANQAEGIDIQAPVRTITALNNPT